MRTVLNPTEMTPNQATVSRERILSVQSHVVFGYVGGKAAVFPLQCLGYDVDVVNTVNYSNHAGYGRSGGTKATAAELDAMFDALEKNEILAPTRLLTGYIPGAEALLAVERVAQKIKKTRPDLIYLLDPVMGDAGKLYVAPDVIPVYRQMLPLATIITPNWYEVEALTEISIKDIASLQQALRVLHTTYQVPNVVISSIPLKPWLLTALPSFISTEMSDDESEYLLCLASSNVFLSFNTPIANETPETNANPYDKPTHEMNTKPSSRYPYPSTVHVACVPLIPGYFSGVGDLFSALLLGHFHPHTLPQASSLAPTSTELVEHSQQPSPLPKLTHSPTPLSYAASLALTKTHAILSKTHDYAASLPPDERQASDDELDDKVPMRRIRRMRGRELVLVQSQDIIRGIGLNTGNTRWMRGWDAFWQS